MAARKKVYTTDGTTAVSACDVLDSFTLAERVKRNIR